MTQLQSFMAMSNEMKGEGFHPHDTTPVIHGNVRWMKRGKASLI
jgi:hypothetical protein